MYQASNSEWDMTGYRYRICKWAAGPPSNERQPALPLESPGHLTCSELSATRGRRSLHSGHPDRRLFAAGSSRLAGLVRNDQDLAAEAEALDKVILAAVAKEPAKRDAAAEQRIRDRLAAIARERAALQGVFASEFPDYAALSNPQSLAVNEIQALLSDGEALLVYATGDKESYVFAVTQGDFDWHTIPAGAEALAVKVKRLRDGLDVDRLQDFDLDLAYQLYGLLIAPVDAQVAGKRHLLVVPSAALTAGGNILPISRPIQRPATSCRWACKVG